MITKYKNKLMLACSTFIITLSSCISPDAVSAKLGTFENRMDNLETIANQQAELIKNTLAEFNSTTTAEVIHSGGGWIVLGSALIVAIFLVSIGLFIRYYLKSNKNEKLLKLVTTAAKNTDNNTIRKIKSQIEHEVCNGGKFCEKDKQKLAEFVHKYGVFAHDRE